MCPSTRDPLKELVILGAGPHAAEMAMFVEAINAQRPTWNLLGYLVSDEQAGRVGEALAGYPVLATHTRYLDGEVVRLPLLPENGFYPDLARIPAPQLARNATN